MENLKSKITDIYNKKLNTFNLISADSIFIIYVEV
jgi:hypothetical protein